MAIELEDVDTFNGTIVSTESEVLEVHTAPSEYVQVLIDDGTTGGTPPQYDLLQEYRVPEFDDYMQYSNQDTQTATSVRTDARGADLRLTFTNSSGADDDYRIVVHTFKEV